jgi:hypothetical protein
MRPTLNFIRHFIEMILAMVAGMAALGMLARAVGSDPDGPVLILGAMALAMTIPMVMWMRFRGHGGRPTTEMAASMLLAAMATLALLGAGLVTDMHTLLVIEHVVMLPAMLVAMLLRRHEYTVCHRHGRVVALSDAGSLIDGPPSTTPPSAGPKLAKQGMRGGERRAVVAVASCDSPFSHDRAGNALQQWLYRGAPPSMPGALGR